MSIASGFLMEHEYDLYKPNHGSIFQLRPLDLAKSVKRNLIHASLAIGTGITLENLNEVMALDPGIVMVGRGIYAASGDPYKTSLETRIATAEEFRARMHS